MISAVFDTNILVSGFVSFKHPNRTPAKLLHLWQAGLFDLFISEYILDEVEQTLHDPYFQKHLSPEDVEDAIILLREECFVIPITAKISGVATHAEDDLIIATAISAKAEYFVTGDGPLLRKVGNSYQGVRLVTPNDFLKVLQEQKS